jgi:hypothetical protein
MTEHISCDGLRNYSFPLYKEHISMKHKGRNFKKSDGKY